MLKKLAAISLTAGALVLIAPTVAMAAPVVPDAASDSYPEPPAVKVNAPIINTCEVSTIVFDAGYFLPSESISVSVSGQEAARAAGSGNTAAGDGSMTYTFRPPKGSDGTYAITFGGSRSYTATITVSHSHDAESCGPKPPVAPAGSELPLTDGDSPTTSGGTVTGTTTASTNTATGIELALTGGAVSPWLLGGGAVALVAGGALVAAGVARRKRA